MIYDCVDVQPPIMHAAHRPTPNEITYYRLRELIDRKYPPGWFVAIDQGEMVSDAESFDELEAKLLATESGDPEVLVVQAGECYPEIGIIL
ncbi:MAG: hypothetical protein WD768_02995 [Phycisphaeraceae bacterium]